MNIIAFFTANRPHTGLMQLIVLFIDTDYFNNFGPYNRFLGREIYQSRSEYIN